MDYLGFVKCVKFLLEHRADKNVKDNVGLTALDYAQKFGKWNLFCNGKSHTRDWFIKHFWIFRTKGSDWNFEC